MGIEHVAAVWEHSRQSGSNLIVLLAVASYSDHNGEWVIDQATLERRSRLGNRRVRQILTELVASGELAVVSHHGRGKLSTYRLLRQENWKLAAGFPAQKVEAVCQFPGEKPEAACQFPAPLDPPFPPDPQIPLYPPEKQIQETFGLRPLTGPQSAVLRVKLLLEEAAVPLPSPAQIGLWSKTLGGIEPLLELLRGLIQAGLANKREPLGYVHRVVIERAAHPEPSSPLPLRGGGARGGARGGGAFKTRNPVLLAGSDEVRRQQALQIIAKMRGKRCPTGTAAAAAKSRSPSPLSPKTGSATPAMKRRRP